jgi:hypothetical protein
MSTTRPREGDIGDHGSATSRNNARLGTRGAPCSALVSRSISNSEEPPRLIRDPGSNRSSIALLWSQRLGRGKKRRFLLRPRKSPQNSRNTHSTCSSGKTPPTHHAPFPYCRCATVYLGSHYWNLRVQYLSLMLEHLFGYAAGGIDPARPLFRGLTHLDLWDDVQWWRDSPSPSYPR